MSINKKAKEIKNKLGLSDDIPILDASAEDFKEQLDFALWSVGGSSDYRNDRERPYNGQSHTDQGERGKTLVEGLTMRDIQDCLIKAMLESGTSNRYLNKDFSKCWNWGIDPPTPTQFLLDRQNDPDFISTKVEIGTWRPQDVYKLNWDNIDPIAIAQNLTCNIEKMMGIFPNINPLE
jgi:hypothetical protein